jgi:hypothetical protein
MGGWISILPSGSDVARMPEQARYGVLVNQSRRWAVVWSIARVAMALAIIAAIIAQADATFRNAADSGYDVPTTVANFFSFFTILSNIATVAVLLWAAVWLLRRLRHPTPAVESRALATCFAAVTTYMAITGVVYNLLLRGLPQTALIGWSNEVLHIVAPIFLVADLLVAPGRRALPWRAGAEVVLFPLAWAVYTMLRGLVTTDPGGAPAWWYPYPFLNPNTLPGGYPAVFGYIAGIAAAIGAVAYLVVFVGRLRSAHGRRHAPQ